MGTLLKSISEVEQMLQLGHDMLDKHIHDMNTNIAQLGLNDAVIDFLKETPDDVIQNYSLDDISNILAENGCTDITMKKVYCNDPQVAVEFDSFIAFARQSFLGLKHFAQSIDNIKHEVDSVDEDAKRMKSSVVDKLNSESYKEKQRATMEDLRSQLSTTEDEVERAIIQRKINTIQDARTLKFLFTRLEGGDWTKKNCKQRKEKNRIMETYFGPEGSYTISRFRDKMTQAQFNPNIYRALFNLDELILPERYHPYNNFFLFHVCRYISHIDANSDADILRMSTIINMMVDVKSGKCDDNEKETLINAMKHFYDFYIDDLDTFKQKNSGYKEHPDRKAVEAELERQRQLEEEAKEKRDTTIQNIKDQLGERLYGKFKTRIEKDPERFFMDICVDHLATMSMKLRENGVTIPESSTYENVYDLYRTTFLRPAIIPDESADPTIPNFSQRDVIKNYTFDNK